MNNLIALVLMLISAAFIAFSSYVQKFMLNDLSIYIVMIVYFTGSAITMWWIVSISSFNRILPLEWKPITIRVVFSILAQFFYSLG